MLDFVPFGLFLIGGIAAAALLGAVGVQVGRLPCLLYLLLASSFYWRPLLTGGVQVGNEFLAQFRPWSDGCAIEPRPQGVLRSDVPLQMLPLRRMVRERLLSGRSLWWSSELGTGMPLVGNPQSAPFAPMHVASLLLEPEKGVSVAAAWQMLLAFLLMHALALAAGCSARGAALASVVFGLSLYQVVWAYQPIGMAAAWLPGLLLGAWNSAAGVDRSVRLLVLCGAGMIVSGHPGTVIFSAIVALIVGLASATRQVRATPALLRVVGAGFLAAAICAPAWVPWIETALLSERRLDLRERLGTAGAGPELALLREVFSPFEQGDPAAVQRSSSWAFSETATAFVGSVPLLFVLGGLIWGGRRDRSIGVAAAGALFLALRIQPLESIGRLLGLDLFDLNRVRLFWVLAAALLAGRFLSMVENDQISRARVSILLVCAMALRVGDHLLFGEVASWQLLLSLAGVAGIALAGIGPLGRQRVVWAALVATVVELGWIGIRFHPTTVPCDLGSPPSVSALREHAGKEPGAGRLIAIGGTLLPNVPAGLGLADARSFDPIQPGVPSRLLRRRLTERTGFGILLMDRKRIDQALLDYLGVRWLFGTTHQVAPPPWQLIASGSDGQVWENAGSFPAFFFPERVEVEVDAEVALQKATKIEDFRKLAVVSKARRPGRAQSGTATAHWIDASRIRIEVSSRGGGVVVSSVSWYPGWSLREDGAEGQALQANAGFVGFEVPPGEHLIELRYRPTGLDYAVAVSVSSWCACLVVIAFEIRRRRRSSAGELASG